MLTLRRSPNLRIAPGTQKTSKCDQVPATEVEAPADKVKKMLLEIAFVLHANRVVAKMEPVAEAKKA